MHLLECALAIAVMLPSMAFAQTTANRNVSP